jgi:hypothetical protein
MLNMDNNTYDDTGNPPIPDFANMSGGISIDDIQTAPTNQGFNFSNVPGGISVADLEKAEAMIGQPTFKPVNIPAPPPPNQPMTVSGPSGFDGQALNSFFDKYNRKHGIQSKTNNANHQAQSTTSLTSVEQAKILNDLLLGGPGVKNTGAPVPKRKNSYVEESTYNKRPSADGDKVMNCQCNDGCENTSCIFYGRSNFISLNDLLDDLLESRIDDMIDSGELYRRKIETKKKKLKKNKYLSDISDSLLDIRR